MIDKLTLRVGNCTHNDARVFLEPHNDSGIAELKGFVRGPFCEFSKTLTADFPLRTVISAGLVTPSVESLVMEPCYWTPDLPFLYEFHLKLQMEDGSFENTLLKTGMKRMNCEDRNLRLQGKRIVLRGLRCSSPDDLTLRLAREHETALIVRNPSVLVLELASRLGVPLIADLRELAGPWEEVCRKLDWYPAVYLVLLSAKQLAGFGKGWGAPHHSLVAAIASASSTADDLSRVKYEVLAVELAPGERPPNWLATIGDPVIAISRGSDSAVEESCARCDRWQTELAPEFDLAGYLV